MKSISVGGFLRLALLLIFLLSQPSVFADDSASLENAENMWATKRFTKAYKLLTPLAAAGNSNAMYLLGLMYMMGDGVQQSDQQAREWWEKAATAGNPDAMIILSRLLMTCTDGSQNKQRAIELLENAAKFDRSDVQFDVGVQYMLGINTKQDFLKAFHYFEKSAKLGNGDSKCILALFYEEGMGVSKDLQKASDWMKSAKLIGCADGEFRIGQYYQIAKNYDKARYWLTQSTTDGNPHAMTSLGTMYRLGLGVKMDITKAKSLFRQAAKNGCRSAKASLEDCSNTNLPKEQETRKTTRRAHTDRSKTFEIAPQNCDH